MTKTRYEKSILKSFSPYQFLFWKPLNMLLTSWTVCRTKPSRPAFSIPTRWCAPRARTSWQLQRTPRFSPPLLPTCHLHRYDSNPRRPTGQHQPPNQRFPFLFLSDSAPGLIRSEEFQQSTWSSHPLAVTRERGRRGWGEAAETARKAGVSSDVWIFSPGFFVVMVFWMQVLFVVRDTG